MLDPVVLVKLRDGLELLPTQEADVDGATCVWAQMRAEDRNLREDVLKIGKLSENYISYFI